MLRVKDQLQLIDHPAKENIRALENLSDIEKRKNRTLIILREETGQQSTFKKIQILMI